MTLGQRIQELRKQNGMSQEGLGERLGVSRQAVSKWEGDNGIPELDTLIAMSRIFGITIGQLLGVEDTAAQEEDKIQCEESTDEERLEAILSKYAKEVAAEKKEVPWFKRWGIDLSAAIVAVVIIIVLFSQISSLRSSVRMLNSDVARLQVQVNNQQSNLNGQIRDTIYSVLTEEAKLLNTFNWEVAAFATDSSSVVLRINASLKEYKAGSQLQFAAQWRTEDGKTGKVDSDWSAGPDFSVLMSLPMNYATEISVRIMETDGTIKEQFVETLHTLDEDNFKLYAYNLTVPFAITTRSFGVERSTARAEQAFVDIMSAYPNIFSPVSAHISAYINDEEVFDEDMTIEQSGDDTQSFCAAIKDNYFEVVLKEGDAFKVVLDVTDNLGRTEQFVESGKVVDGWLEREPLAVPAIGMD